MSETQQRPPQEQDHQPGTQSEMTPEPVTIRPGYKGADKLKGKVALVTGGDSGIGRAVAVHFAAEGADVFVAYLNEHDDAKETQRLVQERGRKCEVFAGDLGSEKVAIEAVEECVAKLGKLDVLVNNAAEQHPQNDIEDISEEQLVRTFRTNIFAQFFMVKAALQHLKEGSTIINTTSVTNYQGSPSLLDYSSTKGAITAFTRSLSGALAEKKIRVNGVAPGPIWTPLIPSTFPPDKVASFGADTPMKRAGEPAEVATCYVFLASEDSSYISGQIVHPNGGEIVNG